MTTYYISPIGSDTNDGSFSSPWATFTHAISQSLANDIIIAKAGTYAQSFTVNKALTIQGTLDGSGNRLSIIDPYIDISGGWTHIGSGVYEKNIGWKAWVFAVELGGVRYKISRLCQAEDSPLQRYTDYCSDWMTHLQKPNTTTYTAYPITINFWDGFEALCSSSDDGKVYVSYKADDNVNNKTILAGMDATSNNNATINITSSNVTIKDFIIYSHDFGVYTDTASNITVDNNQILLGTRKIRLTGDGHIIKNNIITDQNYSDYIGAYDRGAWAVTVGSETYTSTIKYHQYQFTKYGVTADAGGDDANGIYIYGDNIDVYNNTMEYMQIGINVQPNAGNYEVYNNVISNCSSVAIAMEGHGDGAGCVINDNTISDCNIAIRYSNWNGSSGNGAGSNNVDADIYRNKIWMPTGSGIGLYFHYNVRSSPGGMISPVGKIWFYHNSISGGVNGIQISSSAQYYSPYGMGECRFVNNIVSTNRIYDDQSYVANPGGAWYNWITGTGKSQFNGTGTYDNGTTLMWTSSTPHDFTPASTAIENGIDISEEFTIGGTPYAALPGFSPGYFTGNNPNMGVVQTVFNPVISNSDVTLIFNL